jgi:hypothetical protein
MLKSRTGNRCRLQKNGTPLINPMRSGGSPIGVRHPPMLETIKIKNIMIWLFLFLQEFILITGRTISILAPVVPIQLDRSVPKARRHTFTRGDPAKSPSIVILPETQKSPKRRTIKVR